MVTAILVGLGPMQFRSNLDRHFEGKCCSHLEVRSDLLRIYRRPSTSQKLGVSDIWENKQES